MWWNDNHARLRMEREAIAALQSRVDWVENVQWSLDDSICMQVVFDIRFDADVFNLKLTYHNTFPRSVPSVAPVDSLRLSGHQYTNGDLCLEIRPDNWREEYTGADMIESAFKLLDKERPDASGVVTPAPSAHDVPETIVLRQAVSRFYLTDGQRRVLEKDAPNFAAAKIWVNWCGESFVVVYLSEVTGPGWSWRDENLPSALGRECLILDAVVVRSDVSTASLVGVTNVQQLLAALKVGKKFEEEVSSFIVVPSDGEPVLFRRLANNEELFPHRTIREPDHATQRSSADSENLANLRVGLIGLGSLGSKVAVSLARAGVRRFDLIDDDLLHAGNLQRHDGDWRDIGLHKTDLTKRRIELIAPDAIVTARRVSIGAQVSATEAAGVDGALSECDLVLDATANPKAFNHLAAISVSAGKPLVWGAVYAGGIGGFIARSRLGKEADALLIRQAMNDFFEGKDTPAPASASNGYDAQDEGQTIIASDPTVSTLAAHLSALALDTLLGTEPSIYDHPVYLIGFERAWLFEAPFHVQPLCVNAPVRAVSPAPRNDEEQSAFIGELIQAKLDEIKNRQQND